MRAMRVFALLLLLAILTEGRSFAPDGMKRELERNVGRMGRNVQESFKERYLKELQEKMEKLEKLNGFTEGSCLPKGAYVKAWGMHNVENVGKRCCNGYDSAMLSDTWAALCL